MSAQPPEPGLQDLVAEAVTGAGLGPLEGLSPLSGGQLSDVLAVELVSGHQVVAKVYAAQWAWKQAKEVHVLGQMRPALGGLLPEVLWVDAVSDRSDRAVTLMTRLPGVPLSSVVDGMDPGQRRALYRQIGRLARRLHSIAQPAYGYVVTDVLDPVATNRDHMARQFAKKAGELDRIDDGARLADAIRDAVSGHGDALDASPGPVLCHNDLHEGNVLVSEHRGRWRVRGVVDVENAVAADPLVDLAKTDYYSIRGDLAKARGLHDGYGRLGPLGQLRLELYRLYHALELFTWFAAHGEDHCCPRSVATWRSSSPHSRPDERLASWLPCRLRCLLSRCGAPLLRNAHGVDAAAFGRVREMTAVRTGLRVLLLHPPLLAAAIWGPMAAVLAGRGHDVVAPALPTDPTRWWLACCA